MLGSYIRMKGELEESDKALDFEHTVILRPGLIMGNRSEPRMRESAFQTVVGLIGKISTSALEGMGQDASVIARAAVKGGLKAINGGLEEKVWVMEQAEIIKFGRRERKD